MTFLTTGSVWRRLATSQIQALTTPFKLFLGDLGAKAVFTEMAAYERLFGWAIIALTFVDFGKDPSSAVVEQREIREILPYSTLQFSVQASDEDKDPVSERFGLPILYTVRRSSVGGN